MEFRLKAIAILDLLFLLPSALAQGAGNVQNADAGANTGSTAAISDATTLSTATTPAQSPSPSKTSSGMMPSTHDDAPGGSPSSSSSAGATSAFGSGFENYYFVFLALILCLAGLGVFLLFRRKNRAVRRLRASREQALQRDLDTTGGRGSRGDGWANWDPERRHRRYWQGRWRSAEVSREEGLNEQGEAPPPYLPKRRSEEARRNEGEDANGPAVPLQTLSREDAGFKPPDYTETYSGEMSRNARLSTASASSSHIIEHRPSP